MSNECLMFMVSFLKKITKLIGKQKHGFTFVEFIVILSIFGIMASVVLFNFQGFRNNVSLNNLVYDIALEIKMAQTLGVSAPGSDVNNAGQVVSALFEYDGSQFVNAFTIYREIGTNDTGNFQSNLDVILRQADLYGGTLQNISWCTASSSANCTPLTETVYVSFRRPDPEPVVTSADAACTGGVPSGYVHQKCENGALRIEVRAPNDPDTIQYVYIEMSGQIRVTGNA